ncbi:single-stranded nucleic acid-binding protein [Kluyveromyces marxianus]|nr:single-stranded nucleic acid-binding protein [Kluyveromyces marxianus]
MSETIEQTNTKIVVDPESSVFVGNLSPETTAEDLKQVFGESVKVEIPTFQSDRTYPRIFAFVTFEDKVDVEELKEKFDKTVIKDKSIYVTKVLTPEEQQLKKQKRRANQRGKAVPAPPKKNKETKVPLEQMERSKDTLYVNNIPYHTTKNEIASFFGTSEESVVLPMRRMKDTATKRVFFSKKYNRGIAFVSFPEGTDIEAKAAEFNGKTFEDRELTVDVAANKPAHNETEPQTETANATSE